MRFGGFLGLVILGVLGGCGGDAPAGPGAPVDSLPTPTVGPAGGVVSLQGGAVVVDVPAGALSATVTLSATVAAAPSGAGLIPGAVWNLGPAGLTFQVPVRVTLRFAPGDVPAPVDPAGVRLYADTPAGPWRPVPGSTVDLTTGTVSAEFSAFSSTGAGVPVARVVVTLPDSLTYRAPAAVAALARDAAGNMLTAREVGPVSSQDTSIVRLVGQGDAVGVALGATALSASSEGVTGSKTVSVVRAQTARVCDDGASASAPTIAEALEGVADGGTVTLCNATFAERVVIERPVTLEGEAGASPVIEAPLPDSGTAPGIHVFGVARGTTLRRLTLTYPGTWGIQAFAVDDLVIDSVTVIGPEQGIAAGGRFSFEPTDLVIRNSTIDGGPGSPMIVGIFVVGGTNALVELNVVRRTSIFACIQFQGEASGIIRGNLVDECSGERGIMVLSDLGATVDVIGNTVRNSTGTTSRYGINFAGSAAGRIERNVVVDYVQPAPSFPRAGIVVTSTAVTAVRFNDIVGNAGAGLEGFGGLDATCNWWGSAAGPGGANNGANGGVSFTPWATAPIALTADTTCSGT